MQSNISLYEKCPKHKQNDILLICLGGNCVEPMCKECCKLHVDWHNKNGTPPELETVDTARNQCLSDIQSLKDRYKQQKKEQAILQHYSNENQLQQIASLTNKIHQIRINLQNIIDTYCTQLENTIKLKITQNQTVHPSEQRELKNQIEQIISDLEIKEKNLLQPRYMKSLLEIILEEKQHDLDSLSKKIDSAIYTYLKTAFDLNVDEKKIESFSNLFINQLNLFSDRDLQGYVFIHQPNPDQQFQLYQKKFRSQLPIQQQSALQSQLLPSQIQQQNQQLQQGIHQQYLPPQVQSEIQSQKSIQQSQRSNKSK